MKIKFYWFALFASAALIAQAQAGGHHGGGGGSVAFSGGHGAPIGGGARPSYFGSHGDFGGAHFMGPAPGFSSYRGPTVVSQPRFSGSSRAFGGNREFGP